MCNEEVRPWIEDWRSTATPATRKLGKSWRWPAGACRPLQVPTLRLDLKAFIYFINMIWSQDESSRRRIQDLPSISHIALVKKNHRDTCQTAVHANWISMIFSTAPSTFQMLLIFNSPTLSTNSFQCLSRLSCAEWQTIMIISTLVSNQLAPVSGMMISLSKIRLCPCFRAGVKFDRICLHCSSGQSWSTIFR